MRLTTPDEKYSSNYFRTSKFLLWILAIKRLKKWNKFPLSMHSTAWYTSKRVISLSGFVASKESEIVRLEEVANIEVSVFNPERFAQFLYEDTIAIIPDSLAPI